MNAEKLAKILEDHAKWLRGDGGSRADLRGAYLSGANLRGANLYGADLCGADLRRAHLYGANLREADLYGADLREANLYGANLRRADLYGADLREANLYGANLYGADLYGADLREANLYGANLCGADLRRAHLRNITMNWQSHDLISEILYRAAKLPYQEQFAAWVGRKREWCWNDWIALDHPHKPWAIKELKKWVKDGYGAPDVLTSGGG